MQSETKKIDLEEYGRRIFQNRHSPGNLDEINIELSSWFAYYSERMIPLEIREANFWEETKDFNSEKPKSDTLVRALWKITEEGMEKTTIERILKTLEKLMSNNRVSIRRAETELRNLYD